MGISACTRLALIVPIVFAFSINASAENNNGSCPFPCMCFSTMVRCMGLKLTRIVRVPANTTVLDLRFNSITEIRPGSFSGLPALDTLLLSDNRIRGVPANSFRGAANLKILYLHKNRIGHIAPGAFSELPKLEQLYLHYNHLTEIGRGTFGDLPSLERLFLHNNMLRHLPADAFRNVGPMTRLRLDSNNLVCDCNLLWLLDRLRDRKLEMAAVCHSPENMRGRSLTAMSHHDFHCTKPRIMEGPDDVEVRLGGTISLTCRVSGDPRPEVKWTRDTGEVLADGERCVIREDGTLVISGATEEDNGEYECVASSEMGTTKSRKARAVITVTPSLRFTQLPESRTVTAGSDVTFVCKAEGQPAPRIEWWRNSSPLAFGGRIQTKDAGSTLEILAAKESDAARYVCRAKNANGFAETSADLKVLDPESLPPELTYKPQDMEAELGATVEIPCRAEGRPKPAMQWKKDGSALDNDRARVSRGGSLYLYNVTAQDAGRYECSAVNEHGRATAQALMRVRQSTTSDTLVLTAFREATQEIDRAINRTLASLFEPNGNHRHTNPFRLARFPDAIGRAKARPAELFERTLVNVRKLVNRGASANVTGEFRYEEILTQEQVQQIERLSGCTGHRPRQNCTNMCYHAKYRTITGNCNNLRHATWGSSYTGFRRVLQPVYENGFSQPIGWDRQRRYFGFPKPAARLVSTTLISTHKITADETITHMVMQWGQFLDHDLDHALPSVSSESWDGIDCKKVCDNAPPCFPMEVPPGDPRIKNRRCIDFVRTSAVCGSGETSVLWGGLTPREQLNQLTSYLDASQVYGYDDELARDLRELTTDRGLLREGPTIPGHKPLLPYASGQFVDCRRNPLESSINCFVAGDIRANEQVGLLAMHTIWLREHNRIARQLGELNPHWNGEKLYQESRRIVGAEMQHITYRHWLPRVLGEDVDELLGAYRGYDANLDASVSNVFATAALRFGHSLIQPKLARLNGTFGSIAQGPLSLRDAFFSPWRLVEEGGVDPLIRGMFATAAKLKLPEENLNTELTEHLFKTAHAVALDLAAMNIQRAREHGIPGYLEWRRFCNMSGADTFDDLAGEIGSRRIRQKLRELYGHPGNVDVWVGGILEDQLPGAKVGPLFRCLLLEQFRRTRDGDRFWYENPTVFRAEQLAQIRQVSLARVLCDNGDDIARVQPNVFLLPEGGNGFVACDEIPYVDLRLWSDCCDDCEDRGNTISRFRRSAAKYLRSENYAADRVEEAFREGSASRVNPFQRDAGGTDYAPEKIEYLREEIEETERESRRLRKLSDDLSRKIEGLKELLESIKSAKERG